MNFSAKKILLLLTAVFLTTSLFARSPSSRKGKSRSSQIESPDGSERNEKDNKDKKENDLPALTLNAGIKTGIKNKASLKHHSNVSTSGTMFDMSVLKINPSTFTWQWSMALGQPDSNDTGSDGVFSLYYNVGVGKSFFFLGNKLILSATGGIDFLVDFYKETDDHTDGDILVGMGVGGDLRATYRILKHTGAFFDMSWYPLGGSSFKHSWKENGTNKKSKSYSGQFSHFSINLGISWIL